MKKLSILMITLCSFLLSSQAYPQTPPPSQTAGGLDQQQIHIQRERALEKRITKEKKKEGAPAEGGTTPAEEGMKTHIKTIEVRGASLISGEEIGKIISPYEGKELSLKEMQDICGLITGEYRKRGRLTSRAFLPPQTIKDGALLIMVIEGKVGNVEVKGNRYFSSKLIKKKLKLETNEYFDYQVLQRSLTKLNENPDRSVRLVITPGKEPGTTDIVLEVQDKLPFHYGYEFDNFGSRYIEHDRHTATVEHNNFLGLDDKISFKYQKSPNNFYNFYNLIYTVPMSAILNTGIYYLWSDSKLAKEFKASDVKGKSQLAGIFFNLLIIDLPSVNFKFTGGFDYKHIVNYISGNKNSRDESRVVKCGLDLDVYDRWGRTIVTMEEDVGILAGGGLYAKDPLATRVGAGAAFNKIVGNIYRLQPMPFSSSILWKNQFQIATYNLLAVEQFQLGGIANVRGYAPGEFSGDAGLTSSVEWSFPPYFMPKDMKVPLSKSTFYDAARFVGFYDFGYIYTKTIQTASDKKNRAIQGWGGGVRFNLPEDLSARVEIAYRFKGKVKLDDANLYLDFSKKF